MSIHIVSHLYCALLFEFVPVYHPVCRWESHLQSLKAYGLFICDQFVCVYVFVCIPQYVCVGVAARQESLTPLCPSDWGIVTVQAAHCAAVQQLFEVSVFNLCAHRFSLPSAVFTVSTHALSFFFFSALRPRCQILVLLLHSHLKGSEYMKHTG